MRLVCRRILTEEVMEAAADPAALIRSIVSDMLRKAPNYTSLRVRSIAENPESPFPKRFTLFVIEVER